MPGTRQAESIRDRGLWVADFAMRGDGMVAPPIAIVEDGEVVLAVIAGCPEKASRPVARIPRRGR
jgi:hypothetical protein